MSKTVNKPAARHEASLEALLNRPEDRRFEVVTRCFLGFFLLLGAYGLVDIAMNLAGD